MLFVKGTPYTVKVRERLSQDAYNERIIAS